MEIIYDNDIDEIREKLCRIIMQKIKENGYTQTIAAEKLGIEQHILSRMQKGMENNDLNGFSMSRLLTFLKKLDYKIKILIED